MCGVQKILYRAPPPSPSPDSAPTVTSPSLKMLDHVCCFGMVVEQSMLHYLHVQLWEPPGLKKSYMIHDYVVSHFSTIRIPDSLYGWPRSLCDSMKWHSLFALQNTMK
ncbi:hypothetical protein Tco_0786523 [Tanacetum coccineum]